MEPRTVFFIGKPGCGKGTQAKLLSEKTGWDIVSAGKQFRKISREDNPIGRKIKSEIDAGILAPHWFAMHLYLQALFEIGTETNVIFDGFNRKIEEAQLITDSLAWLERPFVSIYLRVSDEVVRERLAGRKEIEGRSDDNAVDERLSEYREFTDPAIALFRTAGALIEIDGELPPEEIAKAIHMALSL
ncbi:MAG TPA: nucleoside monophosphate kinase [Candidatus Paceibacterota bacterium]|nr:nucleoside monophosphate kinase [Candidatus Paceibacterota bacterium]